IDEYMEMYRSLDEDNQIPKQIAQQKERLELAQKKKSKLLEYNVTGQLSDEDFLTLNKQCSQEIADAEAQIRELEYQMYSKEEFRQHMETIRSTLEAARRDAATGMITNEFVEKYIDKILVTPEDDHTLRLDIKIFTGESTQRYLEKLVSRTGHTFKKMIEAYEQGLQ
ncbi:MAG: recombinase family protein, partial [Ruminococcus sp.]|nr:recombinase family protein [Ruminococcus sp.]